MIKISGSGNFKKTEDFISKILRGDIFAQLNEYGAKGVTALSAATPIDTSLTAHSWCYRIVKRKKGPGIEWYNTNIVNGVPVVILIQYGHATGTGGFIHGRDFINPAIQPIFDEIADDIWKKVKT